MEYTIHPPRKQSRARKHNLSPIRQGHKAEQDKLNITETVIELEGINDLFRLLNIEMDTQVDCFKYKGNKYKLNINQPSISQNLYKFLSSSIPKNVAKRISMEEKESDLRRGYTDKLETPDEPCFKERPSTTGGRIFGTVSEELHSNYKPKTSRLDLPSGCICREEIKRLEKEIGK